MPRQKTHAHMRILEHANIKMLADAYLQNTVVPDALKHLHAIITSAETPAGVRVQAIGTALRASGIAERAALQPGNTPQDIRRMTLDELQEQIDKLNAVMSAKTVDSTLNVTVSAPDDSQAFDFVE